MRYDRESIKRKLKRVVKEYCDVSEERIEDYFEDLMEDFADLIFELKAEEEHNDLLIGLDNREWNEKLSKIIKEGRWLKWNDKPYDYWDIKE